MFETTDKIDYLHHAIGLAEVLVQAEQLNQPFLAFLTEMRDDALETTACTESYGRRSQTIRVGD